MYTESNRERTLPLLFEIELALVLIIVVLPSSTVFASLSLVLRHRSSLLLANPRLVVSRVAYNAEYFQPITAARDIDDGANPYRTNKADDRKPSTICFARDPAVCIVFIFLEKFTLQEHKQLDTHMLSSCKRTPDIPHTK